MRIELTGHGYIDRRSDKAASIKCEVRPGRPGVLGQLRDPVGRTDRMRRNRAREATRSQRAELTGCLNFRLRRAQHRLGDSREFEKRRHVVPSRETVKTVTSLWYRARS